MEAIKGFVEIIEAVSATVGGQELHKQGLASVAVGTLAGSASPAGILLAGANFKGYYLKFRINKEVFEALFTDQFFHTGDYIIAVYDGKKLTGINTYAVLNPQNGMLSMQYKLGETKRNIIKGTFPFLYICICICIFVFVSFYYTIEGINFLELFLFILISAIVTYLLFFIVSLKEAIKYGGITEKILELLGMIDINKIDLSKGIVMNENMVSFDFNYRKAVDYDPYPPESIPKKD